jgi:hypothetical protein
VIDWTDVASLATAGGTLVLAVATFAAVRSANRSARIAERSFEIGLRPILAPSRLEDPPQKVMFRDRHWVALRGGRAVVEVVDGVVYLAMLVRNVGSGMAIIESWEPFPGQRLSSDEWGNLADFRPQTRALWIAPGDVAFWQGAMRDETDPLQKAVAAAVVDGALTVDLLYRDPEGGQRTGSRFSLIRREHDHPPEEAEGAEGAAGAEGTAGADGADGAEGVEGHDRSRGDWWVSLGWHRTFEGT